MIYECKFILSYDSETTELEVQSFTVPSDLLDKTNLQHIGALLCTVGVDCTNGDCSLLEES